MPQFNFDPTGIAPAQKSYEPLERGMYQCIIVDSALKRTQAGTGEYIELVLQVTDGVNSGRRLWERLNVSNPNKAAEDIARSRLAELCAAVGVQKLSDTEQLHDIPFLVQVDIDRKDPSRNRLMGYMAAKVSAPAPAQAAAAPRRAWSK